MMPNRVASRSTQPKDEDAGYVDGFPQVFGKYVLLRPMARGGMGELFLAAAGETGGFEKLCVVKKVLQSLADAAVHRRFLDEAKIVVRLNHANLVQVFDAGKVNDEYYLAMELVEGKDLRAVWNRCAQLHRRIPVDVAIFVIREVLRGLDYVHDAMELGLVHRDISPPNILVGYRGDVKLTDFGLAKSAIKREMTSPGVVFGRYSYLSPEQAKGLPADRRTDIYACAIVLWELLTGRQLFPSTNRSHQEALQAVRNPQVRPPSQVVPGVPEGIDEVVLRGLARSPGERFDSAGMFRAALSDVLARDFPKCDADRVAEFMGDIFAREVKLESRDYTAFAKEDFSDLRATAKDIQLLSISDVLQVPPGDDAPQPAREAEAVEPDRPPPRWDEGFTDAESLTRAAKTWVGKVVAQSYRVDTLLGLGSMGAVFRVTNLPVGKPFALKFLHSVYTRDSDVITRFTREARAAAQTGHPNIIDVTDIGATDEGNVYFVMELVEGESVSRVVKDEGPLAIRRAVHVGRQICRALSAAHDVGIIHRDLTSDNVLLTLRGKDPDFVKVLDFGICKQVSADASAASGLSLIMGSPDYMAPEQGAGLEATIAADVYSVGCILFEMLTGRLPFVGRNAVDVLMQKGAQPAPRVTEFRPEVPLPLADVVEHCLERQPGDRPPSMRALEYELTRALDGRAQAMAAVLGRSEGELEDGKAAASASMSMQQAAIAAMAPSERRIERTMIAPPPVPVAVMPGGPVPIVDVGSAQSASRRVPGWGARASVGTAVARALFFVLLGGLLATTAVLIVAPDTVARILGRDGSGAAVTPEREDGNETPRMAGLPGASAGAPPAETASASAGGPEPADAAPEEPVVVVVEDEPTPEPAVEVAEGGAATPTPSEPASITPEELVTQAEHALTANEYREPYDRSMAAALSKLRAVDPSNDNIARLRMAAAEQLLPLGEKAFRKREWGAAADAYRDLLGVWPDHPEAKEKLIEALHSEGKVERDEKRWDDALATADELLNYAPEDFKTVLLRADMLYNLGRWSEARDAYARAIKLYRYSPHAKKRFANASKRAKEAAKIPKGG